MQQTKKCNILVIEDDKDFGESLAELLILTGHKITLAASAEEGLAQFHRGIFDLFIIDIKLPDKNGVNCYLEMLRNDSNTKVIMITGYPDKELIDTALEYGALHVLSKPFKLGALLKLIKLILTPSHKTTVLLAEDDIDYSASMNEYLSYHGYNVIVAFNGEDAVRRAVQDDIDVLVLDLRLPIKDGLAVHTELEMQQMKIPTIISTAYASQEREQMDTLLSDSHMITLCKPYNPIKLIRAIEEVEHKHV